MITDKDELYLAAIRLVEHYSKSLNTLSWIWGGFTIDIFQNRILRNHDDLDCLTLNLHNLRPDFIALAENEGWQTKLLANGDLKIQRPEIKIHLGNVEIHDKACWTHNGERGSLWFPREWLNERSRDFCGIAVHVVEPEFQYVMLERPQLLNPDWQCRQKDMLARDYLKNYIEIKGMDPACLFEQVHAEGKQIAPSSIF